MSLWTLWLEVLCAMMLSSAGGPSLAQPFRFGRRGETAFKEHKILSVITEAYLDAFEFFINWIHFLPWKGNKEWKC